MPVSSFLSMTCLAAFVLFADYGLLEKRESDFFCGDSGQLWLGVF